MGKGLFTGKAYYVRFLNKPMICLDEVSRNWFIIWIDFFFRLIKTSYSAGIDELNLQKIENNPFLFKLLIFVNIYNLDFKIPRNDLFSFFNYKLGSHKSFSTDFVSFSEISKEIG